MIPLSMMRGDTRVYEVTLTNAQEQPIDLDDIADITFTAKLNYDDTADTDTTIVKTLGDGIVKNDPPEAGICTITLEPSDTDGFAYGYRLLWDIEVIGDYEQDTRTVARGWLDVHWDITVTV